MNITFTAEQLAQIQAFLDRGPDPVLHFSDAYAYVADIITSSPNATAGSDLDVARRWFAGAEQANLGQGIFSTFIRAYTERQIKLRYNETLTIEKMQEASDKVAENALQDIIDFPNVDLTIDRIAGKDATGVGEILFNRDPLDSAASEKANSAWSGALLFSALGSDQTGRLLTTGKNTTVMDSVDDLKNVLFAFDAFQTAASAVLEAGFSEADLDDIPIIGDIFWNAITNPSSVLELFQDTVALPALRFIYDLGTEKVLDMLRSAYQGLPVIGTTVQTFAANAHALFSTAGIAAQNIELERLDGRDSITILSIAKQTDGLGLAYRNALKSLSIFALTGLDYSSRNMNGELEQFNPETGQGQLSEQWLTDRALMLEGYSALNKADSVFVPASVSWSTEAVYFFDAESGIEFRTQAAAGGISPDPLPPPPGAHRFLFGAAGEDTLEGGDVSDGLYGGARKDTLTGTAATITLKAGPVTIPWTAVKVFMTSSTAAMAMIPTDSMPVIKKYSSATLTATEKSSLRVAVKSIH